MSISCSVIGLSMEYAARPSPIALGINVEKPKFPQYAVYSKRMESFDAWPEYLPVEKDDLVEAGLVYTEVGDSVRCYFCGGGLRNWEQGDVPMQEHAKWYPKCPHVLLVKGQEYIDKIGRWENPDEDSSSLNAATTKRQEPIETTAAQACMPYFSKDMVMKAVEIFFGKHGHYNFKARDLVEIMFSIEEESEIEYDDSNTCVKTVNIREDRQRQTKHASGLIGTSVQYMFQRHGGQRNKSSATSAWVTSLIKKLMTVLDDTLKTATDIMSLLVERCPQLFPDLSREPTKQDLVTLAEAIGENYRFLGLDLGLSDVKLDQISLDNPTTVMKTYNILREWSEMNPLKATLSTLIQTMKSCRSVKIDWKQIGKVCMDS